MTEKQNLSRFLRWAGIENLPGSNLETVNPISSDSGTVVFQVNPEASSLLYTTLSVYTPEVSVDDPDLLISWPDNLFHNYIEKGILKIGNVEVSTLDSAFFDAQIQFLTSKPNQREQYLRNIGNIPKLNSFSRHLPRTRISFPVPWVWNPEGLPGVPGITFTYTLRPLTDLIRVVQRTPQGEQLRKYQVGELGINIYNSSPIQMTNRYTFGPKNYPSYLVVNTVESFDKEFSGSGEVTIAPKYPYRALLIMAENATARSINNYSNYSDNVEDGYSGVGPLKTIQGFEAETFSQDETFWNGTISPERPGYYFLPLTSNPTSYFEVGTTQAIPFQVTAFSPGDYILRVRTYCSRVFEIRNGQIVPI